MLLKTQILKKRKHRGLLLRLCVLKILVVLSVLALKCDKTATGGVLCIFLVPMDNRLKFDGRKCFGELRLHH